MPTIKFTDTTGKVPEQFYPKPASAFIPEWLKRLKPYGDDKKHRLFSSTRSNETAKKCPPMLDAVMAGYVIQTTEDFMVEQRNGLPFFYWSAGLGIEFHVASQIGTHSRSNHGVPKWLNPFSVQTPAGYSTLFVPPVNQDSPLMTPFSGMVDTDKFIIPINFPFVLTDPNFEGLIPAGTPLVQLIPIRREDWKHQVKSGMTEKIERAKRLKQSVFQYGYKMFFRTPKSYR